MTHCDTKGSIYFEPFHTYIKKMAAERKSFVLNSIPSEYTTYNKGNIFVISRKKLKDLAGSAVRK